MEECDVGKIAGAQKYGKGSNRADPVKFIAF